jgi:hypothetical protein
MVVTKQKQRRILYFFKGFASAFDITGQTLIDVPDLGTGFERDRLAIQGDWRRVGEDIRKGMNTVANEQ